ncbi:DUF4954 family protein [uncultured Porphyromonas sp.]|uniref:DUF4954 family protein n=1 Tax=uncultured Porphyromonas sp. TaxID=159274 RepID=UPI0025F1649C|nr:DUF4954 family protein [uncultured Porphyromonas sp.]
MRHLTEEEIRLLEENRRCQADDWSHIEVSDTFAPSQLTEVTFVGHCTLGDLSGTHIDRYGIKRSNGICHALLKDTTIGDGAYIANVRDCISDYDIGADVTVSNVNAIYMSGSSTFGNGVSVPVLNETGGIEVPLSRKLTAQIAYLLVTTPDSDPIHKELTRLISEDVEECRSERGTIGDNVRIVNTGTIIDGYIGDGSIIDGVSILSDFSLCSRPGYPAVVGNGVIGKHFIAAAGASMVDNCTLHMVFVGQSAKVGNLFSANESLIFSNCTLENGEAAAIVAGPFTVSMHKSSLLIAGLFSFLNAGSGSNQSNHLYKTGPIHHGVVERGSKTSSDSYILWPSRIGPFSLIMGRHTDHVDTSAFPFSYVIENHNETYLVPGRALLTIGTMRDAKKWPSRDHRPGDCKLDCVNYNLLSPYTVGKMEQGYRKLQELLDFVGQHDETYIYHNLHLKSSSLHHGLRIYRLGIDKFIGNSLITRIRDKVESQEIATIEDLQRLLRPDHDEGVGLWTDLCGMIAPERGVRRLTDGLRETAYATIDDFSSQVRSLHERYYELEWDWSYDLIYRWYGLDKSESLTAEVVHEILDRWIDAVLTIDRSLIQDAAKEHAIDRRISSSATTQLDAADELEQDVYVQCVREHMERKQSLYDSVVKQLQL